MSKQRRSFDAAFKRMTVELRKSRQTMRTLAKELNIRADVLYRWRQEFLDKKEGSFPGRGKVGQTPEKARIPQRIKADYRSEFISKALYKWAYYNPETLKFSRPGRPKDNAFIESFNSSFLIKCLNVLWFLYLEDAQEKIEAWRQEYNCFGPHSSL